VVAEEREPGAADDRVHVRGPLAVGERVLKPDPVQPARRAEVLHVAESDSMAGAASLGQLALRRGEPGHRLLGRDGRRCTGQLHAH
jgi:hypothetical protein